MKGKVSHRCAWFRFLAPSGVCPAWARCNRVKVPCIMNLRKEQILDYGNCDFVRNRGKEAYVKDASPRLQSRRRAMSEANRETETWYMWHPAERSEGNKRSAVGEADGMGELAPHAFKSRRREMSETNRGRSPGFSAGGKPRGCASEQRALTRGGLAPSLRWVSIHPASRSSRRSNATERMWRGVSRGHSSRQAIRE